MIVNCRLYQKYIKSVFKIVLFCVTVFIISLFIIVLLFIITQMIVGVYVCLSLQQQKKKKITRQKAVSLRAFILRPNSIKIKIKIIAIVVISHFISWIAFFFSFVCLLLIFVSLSMFMIAIDGMDRSIPCTHFNQHAFNI